MPVVDKNEKWTGEPNAQSDPNQLPQAKNDGSTTTPFVTISEDNKAGGLGAATIQTSALMANDQGGAAKNFYQVVQDTTNEAKVTTADGVTIQYDTNGKY